MLNTVNLIGRLTRDPEIRHTTTGKTVCELSLAVGKRVKPQDGSPDADFFRVVAWAAQADFASHYLKKGRLVSIAGRLQSRRYMGSDGHQREVVEVVAESVQALDKVKTAEAAA